MSESSPDQFNQLSFYTLAHPDMLYFIHQHIVDAFQAQNADKNTKPIALIFSLTGLYLYLEKGYTGKEVQQAHLKLAQNKKEWKILELPEKRGIITVSDVLKSPAGEQRDKMIKEWCVSVWDAYRNWYETIENLAQTEML